MTSPAECRLRSMTYRAPIMMRATTDTGKGEVSDLIHVGDMPIMTQSKYCVLHGLEGREMINMGEDPKDPGGYFIINGSERVNRINGGHDIQQADSINRADGRKDDPQGKDLFRGHRIPRQDGGGDAARQHHSSEDTRDARPTFP